MTSQTYSLIPTSTLASASPTTSDSDGGNKVSDLFSSKGSPGRIVGSLAIGLLVAAIIGTLLWRWLSRSRNTEDRPVTRETPLDTTPVLWDVRAHPSACAALRWEDMAPITASVARPPPASVAVDPGRTTLYWTLRRWVTAVKRFYLRPSPPPPPEGEKDAPPASPLDEKEWGDASSVQVSVIIAMPGREGGVDPRMVLREIGIGTVEVSWSAGE